MALRAEGPDAEAYEQRRWTGARYWASGDNAMVGVAQLVEHWIVAPAVVGSNPIAHPIFQRRYGAWRRIVFPVAEIAWLIRCLAQSTPRSGLGAKHER